MVCSSDVRAERSRPDALRVGYVPGVLPDTWARRWAERPGRHERPDGPATPGRPPLELHRIDPAEQVGALRDLSLDMCLVRDVDGEGGAEDVRDLHLVHLYDDLPVVVASREHPVAAYHEIALAELADEVRLEVPTPAGEDVAGAVAAAASGTGYVVLPRSLARLHQRRDVVAVPVTGVRPSRVALAWLRARDDATTQEFVGVVRGRTRRSSRG